MALPTLVLLVVFVSAYALYKYWDTSRRHRIPKGLKPLPGPKGTAFSIGRNSSPPRILCDDDELY
jgi:hypothetical protein